MNVLAIGAHPDDIELGCGGSLVRHVAAGDRVTMLVMTTGELGPQHAVPRVREQEEAARIIEASLVWGGFSDGAIPHDRDTVGVIDDAVRSTGAHVMYTHAPNDSHQDHVAASTASLAAARKLGRILYYQSPTSTSFAPTLFVDLEADDALECKLEALRAHRSQVLGCELVDVEAINAGSRYWGHRARMRHAEAFETSRFVWDIGMQARAVHAEERQAHPTLVAVVSPMTPRRRRRLASSE